MVSLDSYVSDTVVGLSRFPCFPSRIWEQLCQGPSLSLFPSVSQNTNGAAELLSELTLVAQSLLQPSSETTPEWESHSLSGDSLLVLKIYSFAAAYVLLPLFLLLHTSKWSLALSSLHLLNSGWSTKRSSFAFSSLGISKEWCLKTVHNIPSVVSMSGIFTFLYLYIFIEIFVCFICLYSHFIQIWIDFGNCSPLLCVCIIMYKYIKSMYYILPIFLYGRCV